MEIDLTKIKTIYFIGIKGVAMSGLAVICKQKGLEVFGSDVEEKFITDKILIDHEIEIFENFSVANLDCNPDLVVIGTSWGDDNIEVAEVKKRNLPNITDSEMRGLLSHEKKTIAITGVHGKTTTTAMMAYLFSQAGLDPSFLIGTGMVPDLGSNSKWAAGDHFIVEGDEYVRSKEDKTPKFLDLDPSISVITSLEWEHVDIYPDLKSMEVAFQKLVQKTKELLVVCGDWPSIKKIIKGNESKTITYGLEENNTWQVSDVRLEFDRTIFKVKKEGIYLAEFEIRLFGEHNALNALAVIIIGLNEGLNIGEIQNILKQFKGTQRRFDISERNGITFVDDYAHHPTEIKTTLKAIRQRFPKNLIWCVFQPHHYERLNSLFKDFTGAFNEADKTIILDVFSVAGREKDEHRLKNKKLPERLMKKIVGRKKWAKFMATPEMAAQYLKANLKEGDLAILMGAGDIYNVKI